MKQNRLNRLTEEILDNGLDGIALVPGPDMVYVSGIHSHLSEDLLCCFCRQMTTRPSSFPRWRR